jgi:undecaprenyl-diphosphatase
MSHVHARLPLLAAVWLTGLAIFVVMAFFAAANDTFPNDVWLAQHIQDVDNDVVASLLDWSEDLGDLPLIAGVCAAGAIALFAAGDVFGGLLLVLTLAGRALNNYAIKVIVERPRPSAELIDFNDQPDSFSFPSGHSESAMVLYGLLFYFATVYISNVWARRVTQLLCVLLIAGNGLERVYTGHHWPSDVLGGFLLGALVLSLAIAAHQLAPRLKLEVTSGPSVRLHVRRQRRDQGLVQPRDT